MGKGKKPKDKPVKVPKYIYGMSDQARARVLIETVEPLLDMFAMLDAVFTEDDALLAGKKSQITLGRVYEQWKRTRAALDPGFDPKSEDRRPMGKPSVLHPT